MHFQPYFQHYGLAAVLAVLFLENFGFPVPGEIALLFAAFHLRPGDRLGWLQLCLSASLVCILGQTIGYEVARRAGDRARRLLHLEARGRGVEAYFRRYGPATILFARFFAGLRVLAGPVAGLYHMPRRAFLLYNSVGALAWVTLVVAAGAVLGLHRQLLWRRLGHIQIALAALAVILVVAAWRRNRRPRA